LARLNEFLKEDGQFKQCNESIHPTHNTNGILIALIKVHMKSIIKHTSLLFIGLILGCTAFAQKDSIKPKPIKKKVNLDSITVVKIVIDSVNHDTLWMYEFDEVYIKDFSTPEQREEYRRLVYNVKKVLPYAKLAAFRIQMMEDNLLLITDQKAKDKYIKETEKSIKDEFMETMKNEFSRSQGLLLIKLIHRESGKTTFEILKGYRGSIETFYWSAFAKIYSADLKVEYDQILDYQIENIIDLYHLE
jgi:hypothetical protein